MVLVGAVILPHGAMPFDGDTNSPSPDVRQRHARLDPAFRDKLTQLFDGICSATREIAELGAELYVLHTPHGICLSESYGVYVNQVARGDAGWLDHWTEFKASAPLDQPRSRELKDFLKASGTDVQSIQCYGRSEAAPMRWAEAIPIWYLQKYVENVPKYVIVAQDRLPPSGTLEDHRLDIGRRIAEFVEKLPEKVVVVISGDLSHCYETKEADPLYLPDPWLWDFPTDKEAADLFEESVAQWIEAGTPDEWNPDIALPFLRKAAELDPRALSCGIKGFVVLHGMLSEFIRGGSRFKPHLKVRSVPTYYGMLAATFVRIRE